MLFEKKQPAFYKLDFLSAYPTLKIYKNENYKSGWSLIVSIIVLLGSISFVIFSFVDFIINNVPIIVYSKDSSSNKNRTINLNESLLMFQIIDSGTSEQVDKSIADFQIYLFTELSTHNDSLNDTLSLEQCEVGKNINIKFKEVIKKMELFYNDNVSNYQCISSNHNNITLFYDQRVGYNFLNLQIYLYKNSKGYEPQNLRSYVIYESDAINNYNMSYPIDYGFAHYISPFYEKDTYSRVKINLDYISYESNNGILFNSYNHYSGVSISNANEDKYLAKDTDYKYSEDLEKIGKTNIGTLIVALNQKTYEYYKRSYTKIQSLLANVQSLVHLMIVVGEFLANIVAKKKMNIDIISSILYRNTDINSRHFKSIQQNEIYNKIFDDKKINIYDSINPKYLLQNESISELNKKNNNQKLKTSESLAYKVCDKPTSLRETVCKKNQELNRTNQNKIKEINICTILYSYLCCCQNKKTKFIELCDRIVSEELCVDKILVRLFTLEKMYDLLPDEDKTKIQFMETIQIREVNRVLKNWNKGKIEINSDENFNEKAVVNSKIGEITETNT